MGGRALLAEPMRPAFFRAPTDNDLGGSNNISFAVRCAPHSPAPYRLDSVLDETSVEVQKDRCPRVPRTWPCGELSRECITRLGERCMGRCKEEGLEVKRVADAAH